MGQGLENKNKSSEPLCAEEHSPFVKLELPSSDISEIAVELRRIVEPVCEGLGLRAVDSIEPAVRKNPDGTYHAILALEDNGTTIAEVTGEGQTEREALLEAGRSLAERYAQSPEAATEVSVFNYNEETETAELVKGLEQELLSKGYTSAEIETLEISDNIHDGSLSHPQADALARLGAPDSFEGQHAAFITVTGQEAWPNWQTTAGLGDTPEEAQAQAREKFKENY